MKCHRVEHILKTCLCGLYETSTRYYSNFLKLKWFYRMDAMTGFLPLVLRYYETHFEHISAFHQFLKTYKLCQNNKPQTITINLAPNWCFEEFQVHQHHIPNSLH